MNRSIMPALGALAALGFGLLAVVACQPAPAASPDTGAAAEASPAATEAAMPTEAPMPTEAATSDALAGNWILVSYGPAASPTPVPEGVTVTAKFEGGQVSGTNGCNNYNASYTLDGSSLTISPGASTMMACPDPQGQVEQAYMAALGQVTGFEASEGGLTLLYGSGEALVFKAGPSGLAGTAWDVTNYNNGKEAVVGLEADTTISLAFAEGTVSGKACNNYNGPFTEDGAALTVGPLATTRMMCPEAGVMEQEAAYLTALQAATTWSIDGNMLTLRDASGASQVIAVPAAATSGEAAGDVAAEATATP